MKSRNHTGRKTFFAVLGTTLGGLAAYLLNNKFGKQVKSHLTKKWKTVKKNAQKQIHSFQTNAAKELKRVNKK
jgi:membrane protein YqaA with SNARE-associated domain